MAHPDLFRLAPDEREAREAAERLFENVKGELVLALPASAEILHVGATAIPGCLTKGDLDVAVRVSGDDFGAAEAELAARFTRNAGSTSTEDFAAFEDERRTPHLGIQLTTKGGAFDFFHVFVAALRADAGLLHDYNMLKNAHDARPMEQYRAAKDTFVKQVLGCAVGRHVS